MTKPAKEQNPEERRKFERVDIAHQAQVLVLDARGRKTGVLRQLARGGFMMEPTKLTVKITRFTASPSMSQRKICTSG